MHSAPSCVGCRSSNGGSAASDKFGLIYSNFYSYIHVFNEGEQVEPHITSRARMQRRWTLIKARHQFVDGVKCFIESRLEPHEGGKHKCHMRH